jgi:hypothetical protein
MPFWNAAYNIIYANGGVTIGSGHDGATNGKNALTIPTSTDLPLFPDNKIQTDYILKAADITESPFIEAIVPSCDMHIRYTQIRNGPLVRSNGNDYIPRKMTVKKVVIPAPESDLLEWETLCVEYAKVPGLVVVHRGGAISSHFGVHCVINNIPYITTRGVAVGDELRPTVRQTDPDYKAFFNGFMKGLAIEINEQKYYPLMSYILSTLHNIPFMTTNETQYLGAGIALLLRLGIAACYGEIRHYPGEKRRITETQRNIVYTKVFKDLGPYLKDLVLIYRIFKDGKWCGVYGGSKWADCTMQTINLWNDVCRLFRWHNNARYKRLLSQFNTVINCAHNSGWWLNKYCRQEVFDNASACASWAVVHGSEFYYLIHAIEHKTTRNNLFVSLNKFRKVDTDYIKITGESYNDDDRRDDN